MARDKQKNPFKKGLFPIRLGLPAALVAVLGLAALSVITLSVLKHDTPDPVKASTEGSTLAATNKLVQKIEAPKPAPAAAPKAAAESPAAPEKQPATTLSEHEEAKGIHPDAPKPISPETPSAEAPTMAAASAETSSMVAEPETAPESVSTVSPALATHAETASIAKPEASDPKPSVPVVPEPVWQTADQNWDKIDVGNVADQTNPGGETAKWKELEIGQTVTSGQVSGETAKKEPVAPPTETETAKNVISAQKSVPARTVPAKESTPRKEIANRTESVAKKPVKTARRTPERRQPERPVQKTNLAALDMDLVIVNESGQPGQAEVYRDVLKAMGYPVRTITESKQMTGETTILYRPGMEAKAHSLAKRIPGSSNIAPAEDNVPFDIVILVR